MSCNFSYSVIKNHDIIFVRHKNLSNLWSWKDLNVKWILTFIWQIIKSIVAHSSFNFFSTLFPAGFTDSPIILNAEKSVFFSPSPQETNPLRRLSLRLLRGDKAQKMSSLGSATSRRSKNNTRRAAAHFSTVACGGRAYAAGAVGRSCRLHTHRPYLPAWVTAHARRRVRPLCLAVHSRRKTHAGGGKMRTTTRNWNLWNPHCK